MGEHGTVGGKEEAKLVVIDCPNGMSYIGHNAFGAGARKGDNVGVKISNYIIARTDGLLGDVFTKGKSLEFVVKAEYESKSGTVNPGTFAPGADYVGVHNLDEHL